MSTFIKNQSSWKLTQLKKLTFEELKTEFEKLVKSIENLVPMEADERQGKKGIHIDKSAHDDAEEEKEAFMKDKVTEDDQLEVKSLEVALKRKTKRVVVSDLEDEETEAQGRKIQELDDDPLVSLVKDFVTPTKTKSASREAQEEDISPTTLEAAKTLSKVASQKASQRNGKAPMTTEEIQEEEAARQVYLDALLAKRISKEEELSEQQKKRKAEVQEDAQHYTEEDWDTIRAKLEANAKLTKSLQGESMTGEDFAKRMVEMTQLERSLKTEFEKLVKSIENLVPMEADERVKRQGVQLEQEFSKKQKIKDVPEEKVEEPMKKIGKRKKQIARKGIHIDKSAHDDAEEEKEAFMKDKVTGASSESEEGINVIPTAIKPPSIVDWKIIPQLGLKCVYQIIRIDGSDKIYMSCIDCIYMLADMKYPLSKDACQVMLKMKLLDGTKDEVCYQLLKMIEKQEGIR
ncbi:hypothetical protein Tco_0910092 [Tanacetum coccineum]|uniref:Uncharacterized protein n=1 Tax=Tanacetum coccineum TaxID=301880 RepID=A0ABQ5CTM3_9ASTR